MAESTKDMPMEKLNATEGKEFDAMFIEAMACHFEGAFKMVQVAQGKAEHRELKALAHEVINEQKKEIAQMASWTKDWKLSIK